jgi:hypothetical protein
MLVACLSASWLNAPSLLPIHHPPFFTYHPFLFLYFLLFKSIYNISTILYPHVCIYLVNIYNNSFLFKSIYNISTILYPHVYYFYPSIPLTTAYTLSCFFSIPVYIVPAFYTFTFSLMPFPSLSSFFLSTLSPSFPDRPATPLPLPYIYLLL